MLTRDCYEHGVEQKFLVRMVEQTLITEERVFVDFVVFRRITIECFLIFLLSLIMTVSGLQDFLPSLCIGQLKMFIVSVLQTRYIGTKSLPMKITYKV